MLTRSAVALAMVGLVMTGGVALAKRKKKDAPKPSVTYAKSWDAAVEEAQTLNVPIVVHSHGFY